MTMQTGPARRSDNIGNLCWKVLGILEESTPDPTAAVPLYDAFLEAGHEESADRLLLVISSYFHNAAMGVSDAPPVSMHGNPAVEFRYRMLEVLRPYLFDLSSMCMGIAQQFDVEPEKAEKTETKLDTIRFRCQHPVQVGNHITAPDGERVLVVSVLDDNYVEAVPMVESGYGEGPTMNTVPMGRSYGVRRYS